MSFGIPVRNALSIGLGGVPSLFSGIGLNILLSTAIARFDETGIVGSAPVTAWNNRGSGGSAYDLDVVEGIDANLTATTVNGHNSVNSTGDVGLETTSSNSITTAMTLFMVVQATNAAPAGSQVLIDSRSLVAKLRILFTNTADSNKFSMNQGATIALSEAYDTSLHIHIGQFNNDATSKYTVSGVGTVTGDAGLKDYGFGSIFMNRSQGETFAGTMAEIVLFDYALTDAEILAMQIYLAVKYDI